MVVQRNPSFKPASLVLGFLWVVVLPRVRSFSARQTVIETRNDPTHRWTFQLHERPLGALATSTISSIDAAQVKVASLKGFDAEEIKRMPALGTAPIATQQQHRSSDGGSGDYYPFASMMQGCAAYIANHADETAVIHIPCERLDDSDSTALQLLQDIGLAWLLGMKLVLVLSGQRNASRGDSMQSVEQEAGFWRTELERQLNRCLVQPRSAMSAPSTTTSTTGGNVMSGNTFCFGRRQSPDSYEGRATLVQTSKIQRVLETNDVVLLSPVLLSETGEDWVQVEGQQLAAHVAVKLKAAKLIYLLNEPSILQTQDGTHVQDLPLSLAQRILLEQQQKKHEDDNGDCNEPTPRDRDPLLHHLAWAARAVDRGVKRAHIVIPSDGALLEELFTAQNGANTCLYHDDEMLRMMMNEDEDSTIDDFY